MIKLLYTLPLAGLLLLNQSCEQSAEAKEKSESSPQKELPHQTIKSDTTEHEPILIESGVLTGDIIFQTSKSSQSKAIQLATNSNFSHVGVVFLSKSDTMVLEAVQPVKYTRFRDFINRGENAEYTLMRLKDRSPISLEKQSEMHIIGDQYVGMDYDWLFEWTDDKLYCSELVYKLYSNVLNIELCDPRPLKDYSLNAELVQQKLAERYGKKLPLDELMVSPEDLFQSEYLIEVKD